MSMSIEWMVIALIIAIALVLFGLVVAKSFNDMGADDRDDTKPADLWAGYERRKCKPYE